MPTSVGILPTENELRPFVGTHKTIVGSPSFSLVPDLADPNWKALTCVRWSVEVRGLFLIHVETAGCELLGWKRVGSGPWKKTIHCKALMGCQDVRAYYVACMKTLLSPGVWSSSPYNT